MMRKLVNHFLNFVMLYLLTVRVFAERGICWISSCARCCETNPASADTEVCASIVDFDIASNLQGYIHYYFQCSPCCHDCACDFFYMVCR